jgi:elongation factor Ts
MYEPSAKDVMMLRNKTGLPMMACKAALIEATGDLEKAEDLLRKQLKGKMESRTDRAAGEGRVAIATSGANAAVVEFRAETDFTAKNEKFVAATQAMAEEALKGPVGSVVETPQIKSLVEELKISTGENCSFARGQKLTAGPGESFGQYIHHDGKTAVLIKASGTISADTLKKIGMHITGADPRPRGVTTDDIPADIIERERRFRIEQAMESGKPKEIAEKMVEGGMKKFFAEVALVEQPFIMDPSKTVKEIVGNEGKILQFYRWQVGEQI